MKAAEDILRNQKEVLLYLRSRYPIFHLSNFFFRDLHYGIRMLMEENGVKLGYTASEDLARKFADRLEHDGIFKPIDRQTWVVIYPDFRTPPEKPPAPAPPRPAPAAQQPGDGRGPSGTPPAPRAQDPKSPETSPEQKQS